MRLTSASELGSIIKIVRKKNHLTQLEVAQACGVGVRFIVELEKGKPTCELEKSLKVAYMLGIQIEIRNVQVP
jgi:y4mF family transcriptional regulator